MGTTPLEIYLELAGMESPFKSPLHACRGYVGSWEVIGNRLYMIGLEGDLKDGTKANLGTIFPNYPERVFAHWYSGKVRVPQGKLLEYVHMGYGSVYEKDMFLCFDKGVVTKKEITENGESSSPDAPEGNGIGAMTVFSSKSSAGDKQ